MEKTDLRIVYMGTPEFAVESLKRLVEGGDNAVAVITLPDKPMGRHGSVLQASPVKQYAVSQGLKVLQPERLMDEDVIAVHGITNEFVKYKPTFKEVVDKFIEFIGDDSKLVIHNAAYDMKFLNAELESCGYPKLSYERVVDTLIIARQKFPGSRVNLNELCKRFNVDASARTVHGALLDSELLAEVYLELIGGREPGLVFAKQEKK